MQRQVSEEKGDVRIHPSKARSLYMSSMKDGHTELGDPITAVNSGSEMYNGWVQQPIFLPGCPVRPSL